MISLATDELRHDGRDNMFIEMKIALATALIVGITSAALASYAANRTEGCRADRESSFATIMGTRSCLDRANTARIGHRIPFQMPVRRSKAIPTAIRA